MKRALGWLLPLALVLAGCAGVSLASSRSGGSQAAASYAERVAGRAHVFAGDRVDSETGSVVVYLVHAPRSVIDALNARYPRVYVIENNAPRTFSAIARIQRSIDSGALSVRGININFDAPTGTGHLLVGVSSDVPAAQAYFDATYGRGVVRVSHMEPDVTGAATGRMGVTGRAGVAPSG
jgi:hypothetical protein